MIPLKQGQTKIVKLTLRVITRFLLETKDRHLIQNQ